MATLYPYPKDDRLVGKDGRLERTWSEWFLNLYTVIKGYSTAFATGALTATTGTFSGAVTALSLTLTGAISAASITVTGAVTAATGVFSGALTAASATLSGALSAASAAISGAITAASLTLSGAITERGRATALGEWISPAFDANDFTSTGVGTAWVVASGDVIAYAYTLFGNTMILAFEIATSDVTGAPTSLDIAIPGGFTATKRMRNRIQAVNAGVHSIGIAFAEAGASVVNCFPESGAWTATASDNTHVLGEIIFEVTPP